MISLILLAPDSPQAEEMAPQNGYGGAQVSMTLCNQVFHTTHWMNSKQFHHVAGCESCQQKLVGHAVKNAAQSVGVQAFYVGEDEPGSGHEQASHPNFNE